MNAQRCRNSLIELLRAHIEHICQANDYLLGIKNAVAENRMDELQQSLADPYVAIEAIERLEQQRHRLLESHGFDSDDAGFDKCINWCDDEQGRLSELYRQLIADLVQLQRSIQINSLLIDKGRDRVRRSIGILTGLGRGGSVKTYGSNGKTVDPAGQRDIAIA